MTAPEPTPTVEHIDAVARTMQPGAWKFSAAMSKERARIDARRLLTTTDADAIAAIAANLPAEVKIASLTDAEMLAALVDRGALTEDRERLVRACGCIANEEPAACCDPLASPHWERRLATRWEVAP